MAEVSERAGGAGPRPSPCPRRPTRPRRGPGRQGPRPRAWGRAAALLPSGPEGHGVPSPATPGLGPPLEAATSWAAMRMCRAGARGGEGAGWGARPRVPAPSSPPPAPARCVPTSRSALSTRTPPSGPQPTDSQGAEPWSCAPSGPLAGLEVLPGAGSRAAKGFLYLRLEVTHFSKLPLCSESRPKTPCPLSLGPDRFWN